ncbi:D-amino acid dehydrogenase [Chitinimonas sp. BJYL2]|uniref:D-amino acid dehydrogenase n=1 Tax=Chitinimonas sp. BJYL2 TaxID=2976696 RepID=UPI0022B3D73E|nr:D-amino acid dehydrogenase [Chitinimonas sp. BJYL2]
MREVCVIGGGVVGVSSAWYLAEAGFKVSLLERAATVGTGASYLNGGQLSYRYVAPLADAGVPAKALGWLMDRDGPLRFRPSFDMDQWIWLMRFLQRCHGQANRETTAKLARLGELSKASIGALINEHQLPDFDWKEAGKLVVYRTESIFRKAVRSTGTHPEQQVFNAAECLQAEPVLASLADRLQGGIYTRDEAVADCQGFCLALMSKLRQHPNFAGMINDEATGFRHNPHGRLVLQTRSGHHEAESYVLAAGIQSRHLARSLGLRLPIYPLKGYSLTAPINGVHTPPAASITDFERKILYARIGDRLRIAAMVDLVGEDERIDPARIDTLMRQARADMPLAGDYGRAIPWAGLRPATPDGAPIVGKTPVPGLWFNLGHGPLGFTFATGTARILAAEMLGKPSPLADDSFTWKNH